MSHRSSLVHSKSPPERTDRESRACVSRPYFSGEAPTGWLRANSSRLFSFSSFTFQILSGSTFVPPPSAALRLRQTFFTLDLPYIRDTDFFDRIMLEGSPPKVIWVRLGNIRKADLESLLLELWPAICNLLADADLVEVHPSALEAVKRSEA